MNTSKVYQLLVADLMTRSTHCVHEFDELATAISTMNVRELSSLPVVDRQGRICGVISASDLASLAYSLQCDVSVLDAVSDAVRKTLTDAIAADNRDRKIKELMSSSVETTRATDSIQDAARQMVENGIHHLPVVDQEEQVIGILSSSDIVRWVAFYNGE